MEPMRKVEVTWTNGNTKVYQCNDSRHAANLINKLGRSQNFHKAIAYYGWEDDSKAGLRFSQSLSDDEWDARIRSMRNGNR